MFHFCSQCNRRSKCVKAGKRTYACRLVQQWRCRKVGHRFTLRHPRFKNRLYSPRAIISAISLRNQGYSLREIRASLEKTDSIFPAPATIASWLSSYKSLYTTEFKGKGVIKTKNLRHWGMLYRYAYHQKKLDQIPDVRLRNYLLSNGERQEVFQTSQLRCSTIKATADSKPKKIPSHGLPQLTSFALARKHLKYQRHALVLNYLLTNDPHTIAVEVPVYLKAEELPGLPSPITGHIDLIQIRDGKIYVLDYKPRLDRSALKQTYLYALALSKRTGISLKKFVCGWFNGTTIYLYHPKKARIEASPCPCTKKEASLFTQIASLHNLQQAFKKVMSVRGYGRNGITASDLKNHFDLILLQLHQELLKGYKPAKAIRTIIGGRAIDRYAIKDRIILHALKNILSAQYEKHFSPVSYAARIGRHPHHAIRKVQQHLQSHPHVLKTDIKRYFESIDRDILLEKLHIKESKSLFLLKQFLPGPGLSCGSPLSHLLANIYLTSLDTKLMKYGKAVRYMDDIVVCFPNKKTLAIAYQQITSYLKQLKLTLNDHKTKISHKCTSFLGFNLTPQTISLTTTSRQKLQDMPLSQRKRAYHYYKLASLPFSFAISG